MGDTSENLIDQPAASDAIRHDHHTLSTCGVGNEVRTEFPVVASMTETSRRSFTIHRKTEPPAPRLESLVGLGFLCLNFPMAVKNYHVLAKVDGGWKVVRAGAIRASKAFATKSEAVKYARNISRSEHSELIIHGVDGRLQERTSFASDPMPSKAKS